MSGNQPTEPFADKYSFVEDATVDSGFISGEITEDYSTESTLPPANHQEQQKQSKHHLKQEVNVEDEFMRLDSGVDLCLSESFSNLCLKNPHLNDFSKTTSKIQTTTSPVDSGFKTNEQDIRKICFEQDDDGDTHLHLAIANKNPIIALALIRLAPHPFLLDTPNDDAQTPIHLATSTGQAQIVRWLIAAGAKPLPRNKYGDSPLHIAARNNDVECLNAILYPVQKLEKQSMNLSYSISPKYELNLDQWNYIGQTCVHVAAINGNVDILRHLIYFGADINAREGLSGYTALHYSMEQHDECLQRFLLNECQKKINENTLTYGGKSARQLVQPMYSSSDDDDDFDSDSELV